MIINQYYHSHIKCYLSFGVVSLFWLRFVLLYTLLFCPYYFTLHFYSISIKYITDFFQRHVLFSSIFENVAVIMRAAATLCQHW